MASGDEIPEQDACGLLFLTLQELMLYRDSNMYRSDSQENEWPTLHAQYLITLKQFVQSKCARGCLYIGIDTMLVLSVYTVMMFWQAMEGESHDISLKNVVQMWERWHAMVRLTESITDNFHGWGIEGEENLPWPYVYARKSLATTIMSTLGEHDPALVVNFLQSLGSEQPEIKAFHTACEYFKGLPWHKADEPTETAALSIKTIQEAYERVASSLQDTVDHTLEQPQQVNTAANEDIVTITTKDNVDIFLRRTSFLYSSSRLFDSLCLRNNEKITIDNVESTTLNLAIKFCILLEQDDAMSEPRITLGQAGNQSYHVSEDTYGAITALQSEFTPDTIGSLMMLYSFLECTPLGLLALHIHSGGLIHSLPRIVRLVGQGDDDENEAEEDGDNDNSDDENEGEHN